MMAFEQSMTGMTVHCALYLENTCVNINSTLTLIFGAGYSRCWLRGTTYQNNSLVTLEDIGEGGLGLYCIAVCYGSGIRNWFFPNGTRVPSEVVGWDFYHMYSSIYRRRGGVNGIYHCVIPDAMNVTQTIYIGVYTASTGE